MIYLTNRDGGKTDEAGHYQFLASGFDGNVLDGLTLLQQSPLGMKLNLTAGNARIPYGGYAYSAFVQEGETEEVQIGTANPSNPRIDRVVMYIDRAMARQTVNPNNPGIAKIAVVAGTPAGTPVRPSDVSVNAAVGNNPWIDLADVRVNTGVTQITTSNVTDKRVMASAVLGPNAVTADKIDFTTLLKGQQEMSTGVLTESFVTKATIDISAVPNGYTVEISMFGIFDGSGTLTNRMLRATYNSVNYDSTLTASWGNSQSRVFRIVKVSGQNSITIQAKKDNSSAITLSSGQALWKVV